jgi:hypothetical protein
MRGFGRFATISSTQHGGRVVKRAGNLALVEHRRRQRRCCLTLANASPSASQFESPQLHQQSPRTGMTTVGLKKPDSSAGWRSRPAPSPVGIGKHEISRQMRGLCVNSFDVVEGICNGSKHCGNDRDDFRFAPGTEEVIPVTGYGVGGGRSQFRWGGAPGLVVEHNGERLLVDFCLCAVLWSYGSLFPAHLGTVDFRNYKSRLPGD